jgi:hypothetical protein
MLVRVVKQVVVVSVASGAMSAAAQIQPYTPPEGADGADWTARIGEILPEGVESRAEARVRLSAYEPDPDAHPIPRTAWDGKPDFSGVYWPDAVVTPPPVPLESLYRDDVDDYREAGGAAAGLIDWRGIDTPRFHCWPRTPAYGSVGGTIQLVSTPGYLLMKADGQGNSRVIPIVDADDADAATAHPPSYQGSSVAHWDGDTLVVEVTNFNGRPWLTARPQAGGLPQTTSDELRIVERWRRPDGRTIEYSAVIEDPKMLTAPWTSAVMRREILSYDTLQEAHCFIDPELEARHEAFAEQAAQDDE